MNDTTKICTKCGESFPATNEYFYAYKRNKNGLSSWCKSCCQKYNQVNRNKRREYHRDYQQKNQSKIQLYQQEYYRINKDRLTKQHREYWKKYRQENLDRERERKFAYRQSNPDKVSKQQQEYYANNPDKRRVITQRRRARKNSLPDTFTEQQWITCLEYFNHSCAVCGIEFGDSTPHADHWIPLSSDECTGTIATNMICLCSSCNLSKFDKMPNVWLAERYEIDKSSEILKRIETYFDIVLQ